MEKLFHAFNLVAWNTQALLVSVWSWAASTLELIIFFFRLCIQRIIFCCGHWQYTYMFVVSIFVAELLMSTENSNQFASRALRCVLLYMWFFFNEMYQVRLDDPDSFVFIFDSLFEYNTGDSFILSEVWLIGTIWYVWFKKQKSVR